MFRKPQVKTISVSDKKQVHCLYFSRSTMSANSNSASHEDGPGANIVEACSWDLTMGAANHLVGKIFLRTTSSSSNETPEAIDHVGIICFNRLYEYGHSGIKKSNIPRNGDDPHPQYPGCKLRKREYLGRTVKSREEFMEWLVNVKYGEFRGSNYDMIHHNCLDFAKAVSIFLKVPPNPNWEKISNWAKNNQKIAGLFTRGQPQGPGPYTPEENENPRRSRFRHGGRSMTIPEESTTDDLPMDYETAIASSSSPRRRRLSSMNPPISSSSRSHSRFSFRSRSASLETLPPTYEEALSMSKPRRESILSAAPSYEALMNMGASKGS